MKNQLFEDLIESIKELPTEILEEMRMNTERESKKMDVFEAINEKVKDELKGVYQAYSVVRPQNKATQEEQMRKEFEEWFKYISEYSEALSNVKYSQFEKHLMWNAWRASREGLVVELPDPFSLCDGYGEGVDLEDVKEALSSQGIGYK